jgi:hypothetical protein
MVNTVRDGKAVEPTCPSCGCRLNNRGGILMHFLNWDHTTDARGCKCKHLNHSWMQIAGKWSSYAKFTNIAEY